MGAKIVEFWTWLTTSKYTRSLEQEVERLRARDIAVVDSLLTQVGAPAIGPRISKPQAPIQGKMLPSQVRRKFEAMDYQEALERETQRLKRDKEKTQ